MARPDPTRQATQSRTSPSRRAEGPTAAARSAQHGRPETGRAEPTVRAEAARQAADLLDRLRLLIHYSPRSQRQIEQRAGFPRGYLSQILTGQLQLRVEHLLALILALDLQPKEFFDGLFSDRRYRSREDGERPSRRDATQALSLELAKRYGVGLDSLEDLLWRLETYESSLRCLEASDPSSAGPRPSASLCDG